MRYRIRMFSLLCRVKLSLFIWKFLCLALPIFWIGNTVLFAYLDYEDFTDCILANTEKENWRTYFQKSVFPLHRYQFLPHLLGIITGLNALFSVWFWKRIPAINRAVFHFWKKVSRYISRFSASMTRVERFVFSLLLTAYLIRSAYQIQTIPITYDEAWTYNHFISKGLLVSIFSPNNNHVLYTILSVFTDCLPLSDTWTLRLVALLTGILSCFAFYGLARSIFCWRIGLILLSYFIFAPSMSFFSVYARGYSLLILGAILSFWAVIRLTQYPESKATWWFYIFGNFIGFYGCLAYVYNFLPLLLIGVIWMLIHRNGALLKHALVCNLILFVLLSIFYSPLLLTNGGSFLVQAAQTTDPNGINATRFWIYTGRLADWLITGQSLYLYPYFLVFALILLGWVYKFKNDLKSVFIGFSVILYTLFPALLYLLTETWTVYRIWCFELIYISLGIGLGLKVLPKNSLQKYLPLGILIGASLGFMGSQWHYFTHWSRHLDREVIKIHHLLLKHEVEECYAFSNYEKPLLKYYQLRAENPLQVYMPFPNSKDYKAFNQRNYQAVLWDKEAYRSFPKESEALKKHAYVSIYENERIILYIAPQFSMPSI